MVQASPGSTERASSAEVTPVSMFASNICFACSLELQALENKDNSLLYINTRFKVMLRPLDYN